MEKDKLLSKDDAFKQQEDVQKLTDKFIEIADKTYAEKEKEHPQNLILHYALPWIMRNFPVT